jgi:hypothetical protein
MAAFLTHRMWVLTSLANAAPTVAGAIPANLHESSQTQFLASLPPALRM